MKLVELLKYIEYIEILGSPEKEVNTIEFDSRKVKAGSAFVAQRGSLVNGHQFIQDAINQGATTIFCEKIPSEKINNVTFIRVSDSNLVLGELAASFYQFPSTKIKVIGITGTNGKTSIATLLYRLFLKQGYKTGLISTISYMVHLNEETASHTTPDALKIQQLLAEMVERGCEFCFMEVSSHAIHQQRIAAIEFAGGVFTNITHDHLDYHKTFAEYIKAKKTFFDNLPQNAFVITNIDDKNGLIMIQNTKAEKVTYSNRSMADFRCKVLENHFDGMLLNLEDREIWTRFVGKFNASNLLAVYATAIKLGQEKDEVLTQISKLEPVRGRFETLRSVDGKFAIVDYAHTPDALKNVLSAISELRTRNEQVITVIGAGGDRDKTKRPQMANEATLASDKVILTSDNPRTENPALIINDMEAGVKPQFRNKVVSIENRKEAIKTATMLAQPGDIILIAGKGHENYQEINGVKYPFDDKEILKQFFGTEI
ncbi:MAG: UDP-N-acetylmuramoyl-L-alanyl-D-glutamate--2,6-diaminopimelate ligase [Prolixibacteraceae bacterium]|jgi:UDP-N-acetylmuramoyl-L-alanyl-D-glutamate--2,6-diaminopimelate ligase|nr:UDP-N-acetylmuramoyl-L-alanyl-D-glutamate--2,6-diaminopimelate ligase [Prolixibacteraceae bacterium]MBT6006273.1 UDP-N-acetylmuramoyl-L-alanyl-D-glutamate--2,6-diaminopimelate ligase [Prolixibacteraceae bacterium]MBT6766376.1 UDP-N-acetylmuramoyl-L-alanyl-D-glutamate--2,6-diaminopimelate ligase [Prolixibacteraceae bacterium]MBT6997463.1 UDP-N-acetylmuramoyl-L-alanyl-D-glutamate--2,6-diaminopimelate ligase [Prolixibacteraceae bacterium]MBT7395575.1 UDP-N-acetylmuramoyl-L-alanyl-D-glutamate--2